MCLSLVSVNNVHVLTTSHNTTVFQGGIFILTTVRLDRMLVPSGFFCGLLGAAATATLAESMTLREELFKEDVSTFRHLAG